MSNIGQEYNWLKIKNPLLLKIKKRTFSALNKNLLPESFNNMGKIVKYLDKDSIKLYLWNIKTYFLI